MDIITSILIFTLILTIGTIAEDLIKNKKLKKRIKELEDELNRSIKSE